MRRMTTLLIIVALVLLVPAGPVLAHPPICEWASPAAATEAVASEVGALVPALASIGIAEPAVGYRTLSIVRLVLHQIDARYEVCID